MRAESRTRGKVSLVAALTLASLMTAGVTSIAASKKPNILILWGDDIGYWNRANHASCRETLGE